MHGNMKVLIFFLIFGALTYDIAGPGFGFHIDFSYIFSYYSKRYKLHSAYKAHNTGHAGPAGNRVSADGGYKGPDAAYKA